MCMLHGRDEYGIKFDSKKEEKRLLIYMQCYLLNVAYLFDFYVSNNYASKIYIKSSTHNHWENVHDIKSW